MIFGSTPAWPYATSRAIGFKPFFAAADFSISTTAAAASLMPDALPAVTVPFSLMKTARSLAMPSAIDVAAHVLVGVEHHRPLLALELDRQDLALEVAGRDRRRGALVALARRTRPAARA